MKRHPRALGKAGTRYRRLLLVAVLAVGGVVGTAALLDGDEPATTASNLQQEGAPGAEAPATESPTALSAGCASLHEGHEVMAWDPTMADAMVERGCDWPYEPFLVPVAGGVEDPTLEAPFEPRRYGELWDAIATSGGGVCQVAAVPDLPADGFAFGFKYSIAPPGCPDASPTVTLLAREYASRGWRDQSARQVAGARALVLGRWVLSIGGEGDPIAQALRARLVALGAVDVPPT